MFKYLVILFLLFLLGCARSGEPDPQPPIPQQRAEVLQKVELYSQLVREQKLGESGFLYAHDCDALLASSLMSATGQFEVNINAARSADGAWHRRPVDLGECYQNGSGSSISRDMFTGLLWHFWRNKKLDDAVATMEYARKHDYIMGEGDLSRTPLLPNLTKQLAEIIYELSDGKKDYWAERHLIATYAEGLDDYEAHIQMWQILLDAELHGNTVTEKQLTIIKQQFARRPDNPLFAAAHAKYFSGDYGPAHSAILHPRWPADHLPTFDNYCTSWWLSTDNPRSMGPCPSDYQPETGPTGAEILVVYYLVMPQENK